MPGPLFECNPEDEVKHEGALTPQLHIREKDTGSKYTRQVACHPVNYLKGK